MKKGLLIVLSVLAALFCCSQGIENYPSLDARQPIFFGGRYIVYDRDTIQPDPRTFFIDRRRGDTVADKYPYVFNSVNKAVTQLINGTEDAPMVIWIAAYVYWIGNPDDTTIRSCHEIMEKHQTKKKGKNIFESFFSEYKTIIT